MGARIAQCGSLCCRVNLDIEGRQPNPSFTYQLTFYQSRIDQLTNPGGT